MSVRRRRSDVGGLVFGVILLLVGGYYLLTKTFGLDLPDLDWGGLWPILVIGLGVIVLVRAIQDRGDRESS